MTINRPYRFPLSPSARTSLTLPESGRREVVQPARAPTVLVVHPDRTIRTVVISALQGNGYRGVGVGRGDEALFLLLERRFDAVLLGAQLPGIGAHELCLRLRAIHSHSCTPILCLLHPNEQVQMDEFFIAGGDDFLTLPLSPPLLKTRLAGRLRRGEAQKREATDPAAPSRAATADGLNPGAGVMVVRSWVPQPASNGDIGPSALGARGIATQLGLQVECIYRFGGRVERLVDGVVHALFDGPTGIFDAGQCSNAILALGAGASLGSDERPRVALGIVGCGAVVNHTANGAARESVLEAAFAAALAHCMAARAMQVMVSPELHGTLGGLAHIRYARLGVGHGLPESPMNVPVKRLKRARGHAP